MSAMDASFASPCQEVMGSSPRMSSPAPMVAMPSPSGMDAERTPGREVTSVGREDSLSTQCPPATPPQSSVRRLFRAANNVLKEVDLTELAAYDASHIFKQRISSHHTTTHENTPAPPPRFGHTAVVHEDTMIIFGGRDSGCFSDLWTYNFVKKSWKEIKQDELHCPLARAGHTAVVQDGFMYVFGGVAARGGVHNWWLNDLWKLDLKTLEWSHIYYVGRRRPESRKGHTAFTYNNKMYIFGGGQDDANQPLILFNDLWEFDICEGVWTPMDYAGTIPPPRMYHVGAMREGSSKYLIFGGRTDVDGAGFLNDVFELDVASFSAAEVITYGVNPPVHRMCSTALYANGVLSIFAGGAYAYLTDSHQLDLNSRTWTQINEGIAFGGRTRPTTVRWQNTVLTFGGFAGGYRNDCIEIELEPPTLQTLAMQRLLHRGKALLEEIPSLPKKVAVEVARALREFPSQCE